MLELRSTTEQINPASRDPFQSRDQGKRPDFEIFERGDAVSIKESTDRHIRYGWIMSRGPAIEHTGTVEWVKETLHQYFYCRFPFSWTIT